MLVSFDSIIIGKDYSRKFLAEAWGYAAFQALARGVVTPKGDSKIILFVTAEKQGSLEQYADKLIDEYLHWEGPNDHFAESRMVNARSNGEEIHLFFRSIHHTNFIYFGKIEIVNVQLESRQPSKFIFHLNDYYADTTYKTISDYWTREQLLAVFNLYLKLPPSKLDPSNYEIKKLASLIGKSDSSVAVRLNNFAFVDPYNQQHGMIGLEEGAEQIRSIWNGFMANQEDTIYESEQIVASYQDKTLEEIYTDTAFQVSDLKGDYKIRSIKTRVNQNVFRKIILKTYSNRCAISGLNQPELLIAGHIVPWAVNKEERLNPENGICLSHLYDRAYETGLICIDTDYKVLISRRLKQEVSKDFFQRFFGHFEHKSIQLPKTYQPKKEFLEYRLTRFDK
ncbi:HNH endonuclease [Spirosoma radiotolerans]|uniref:HNH endonuclease n=1 Tax=Spirosoma radiotolerans TaxID=1379870 RepID=UPI000A69A9DC|nr:HNH endonuclease [Spirosoma radiotolerans]